MYEFKKLPDFHGAWFGDREKPILRRRSRQAGEQILSAPHYLRGAQAAKYGAPHDKCPFEGWYAESWLAGWDDEVSNEQNG